MNTEDREQERKRAAQAELAAKYRKIGPAALLAALVFTQNDNERRKPQPPKLATRTAH